MIWLLLLVPVVVLLGAALWVDRRRRGAGPVPGGRQVDAPESKFFDRYGTSGGGGGIGGGGGGGGGGF